MQVIHNSNGEVVGFIGFTFLNGESAGFIGLTSLKGEAAWGVSIQDLKSWSFCSEHILCISSANNKLSCG